MNKNIWQRFGLVGLVLLAGVLTGCERKGAYNPADQDTRGYAANEIVLWTANWSKPLNDLAREFNSRVEANGKQIKVVSIDSQEQLERLLPHALIEGWGPDLVVTTGDELYPSVQKFAPVIQSEGFTEELFREVFVRSAADSLIRDGQIYGVPLGVDTLALLYNRNHILDKLPNRNVPAKNWDELQEDAQALSQTKGTPAQVGHSGVAFGEWSTTSHAAEIIENIMWQMGGEVFDPKSNQAVFHRLTQPINQRRVNVAQQAWGFWRAFANPRYRHYSWPIANFRSNESGPVDWQAFSQQKTSIIFAKASEMPDFEKFIAKNRKLSLKNIGSSLLPRASWETEANQDRRTLGTVWALAIPRTSKHQVEAWSFLKFFIGQETMTQWYKATDLPTPRVALIKPQEDEASWPAFVRQAKFARARQYPLASLEWKTAFREMFGGTKTSLTTSELEKGANHLNTLLQQWAKLRPQTSSR